MLLGFLLVFATLWLYGSIVRHDFLTYDDDEYVTHNLHVRAGLNRANLAWALTSLEASNWHPVTWLSHMADCQFFGLNSAAHHYVNLVLHAANVLLLFWLLQHATGSLWRSFLVAALFALHPLNVETVAWIAERKSLLSAFFSLLTVAAYGWYVQRPEWKKYLALIAAFALALGSKPMAVTLPVILLLLDYWPLERYRSNSSFRQIIRLLLEKFPLFLMSAASAAITMLAQRSSVAVKSALPFGMRVKNAVVCLVEYISKMLWPAKLSVFYPHPEYALPWWKVTAAVAILGTISALVFHFRRRRYLVTGWLLFVTALLPVIGIVQAGRQAMADRYAYIPLIGLFIIVVWESANVTDALAISCRVRAFAAAGLLLALAATTSRTLQYWQDGVTLFTHARLVASRPDYVIEQQLGYALDAAGRPDDAMKHHMAALELNPRDASTHYNVATELLRQGEPRAAIKEFQLAMRFPAGKEVKASCSNNTGVAYLALNEYDAAEKNFTAALNFDPNHYSSLLGRGQLFYQQARFGAAANDFGRAARINPDAAVLLWLGKSLESSGKMDAAIAAYEEALRRNPGLTEARSRIDSAREQPARPGLRDEGAGQQR